MKTPSEFDKNTTLDILEEIQQVAVSHELKKKIMQRIESTSQERSSKVITLRPALQWAAAVLVLLLNATVLYYTLQSKERVQEEVTDLESFARAYHLSSDDTLQLN